jgi:predicted acylesterase/phospholipase RssA
VRALVLSGGGAKGAYEAGVAVTLVGEFKEHFDIVCGTSIGAINASFIAQENVPDLVALWHGIAQAHVVDQTPLVQSLQNLYVAVTKALRDPGFLQKIADYLKVSSDVRKLPPFDELLKTVGALNPAGMQRILHDRLVFPNLRKILITTATNFTSSRPETFYAFPQAYADKQKGFLNQSPGSIALTAAIYADAVRASAAIPLAFSPIALALGGKQSSYLDGGITNNTPIGQAINAGADDVTVIYVDPKQSASQSTSNLGEILMGCFSIMQQRILELDYAMAMRTNKAVSAGMPGMQNKHAVKIRAFYPDQLLPASIIGFNDQAAIDKTFAAGQNDARSAKRLAYET